MTPRRFSPPWSVEDTDACFGDSPTSSAGPGDDRVHKWFVDAVKNELEGLISEGDNTRPGASPPFTPALRQLRYCGAVAASAKEEGAVMPVFTDQVEHREAVPIAHNSLTVDQA